MGTNLKGPFFLSRALAPELSARGGRILNIADINGYQPLADYPIYSIAKAGNIMLTKALALELAPNVQVNGIAPGSILWPEGNATMSEQTKADTLARIPLGRLGTEADIAQLATLLITRPGYMTGEIIAVDGGQKLSTRNN
jgi:pteridine reductase